MFLKPKRPVDRIFLHCSASDNPYHDDISVIRKWHLEKGWSDVGYHYFITKSGELQEGRPLNRMPAAQAGHNRHTIAICSSGLKDFPSIQKRAVHRLCRDINEAYKGRITFHGHSEVSNKSCPVYDYKVLLGLDAAGHMPIDIMSATTKKYRTREGDRFNT